MVENTDLTRHTENSGKENPTKTNNVPEAITANATGQLCGSYLKTNTPFH